MSRRFNKDDLGFDDLERAQMGLMDDEDVNVDHKEVSKKAEVSSEDLKVKEDVRPTLISDDEQEWITAESVFIGNHIPVEPEGY